MLNKPKQLTGTALPLGEITCSRKLNIASKNPSNASGLLPTLFGELPEALFAGHVAPPTYIGHGALRGGEQVLISFRLQVGTTMVYWLADPHDAQILKLLEIWAAVKQMSITLKTKTGIACITRDYDEIPTVIRGFCETGLDMDTERFIRCASELVSSGALQAMAKSDIPSVQKLNKVEAFLILGEKARAEAGAGKAK